MPDSIIDLFLQSFRIGHHTRRLLNHLVIVALDDKAFRRCQSLHHHCYALLTEGTDFSKEAYFMTPDYLKMMWRRIDLLRSVLEMGYNFVFTVSSLFACLNICHLCSVFYLLLYFSFTFALNDTNTWFIALYCFNLLWLALLLRENVFGSLRLSFSNFIVALVNILFWPLGIGMLLLQYYVTT